MSVPLLLLLLAPLAGVIFAIAFAEAPRQRRVLVAISSLAMVGGAAAGLVRATAREAVSWRGFDADAWTALLALAAIAPVAAGVARAARLPRPGWSEAALFACGAAGVAPLLVGSVHLLAVTLPVSTLAFACCAVVVSRGRPPVRVLRSVAALALSDVLLLLGLGTAVSNGTRLPPELSTTAAALVLAGAAIRLGLVPVSWGADDAAAESRLLAAAWLGPMRAQGLLVLPFALSGERGVAYAAAGAAAATAVVAAATVLRRPDVAAISTVGVALAVLGLSLGGPSGLWGATLAIAATFAFAPAWYSRGGARELSRPNGAAMPAGALLPGAVLVLTAAFDAAAIRPGFLAFAIPATLATIGLGAAALSGVSGDGPARRGGAAAAMFGALSVAALVAIAALPQRATSGLAFPVADALGVGRLLGVGDGPGVSDELAVIMIGAALVAFLVGPGRVGIGGAPLRRRAEPPEVSIPIPRALLGLLEHAPAWTVAGAILVAGSIGVAIRIYLVAAGRGFL